MKYGSAIKNNYYKPEATTGNGIPIIPCSLIAWSLFNDISYNLSRGDKTLTLNKKCILWKSNREHKFGKNIYPKNFQMEGDIISIDNIQRISARRIHECGFFI